MALALAVDAKLGWPQAFYVRIGHPVTWLGALIARLDSALNQEKATDGRRVRLGALTVALVVAAAVAPALALMAVLPGGVVGVVLIGVLAWPLLAARSLAQHVAAVAAPLAQQDLAAAREAVSHIVGRDPAGLDAAGTGRAALESLAENASDGVIAPLFWGAVFGLPGVAGYKAVNTLDSMIGHRTPRHSAFGQVAARLDDVVNWVPARLTGALFAVVAERPGRTFRIMMRDARQHRSPNAGWPEAAMAGALDRRLSGPRSYDGRPTEDPWLNPGAADPSAADVARGLHLYRRALWLAGGVLLFAGGVQVAL